MEDKLDSLNECLDQRLAKLKVYLDNQLQEVKNKYRGETQAFLLGLIEKTKKLMESEITKNEKRYQENLRHAETIEHAHLKQMYVNSAKNSYESHFDFIVEILTRDIEYYQNQIKALNV